MRTVIDSSALQCAALRRFLARSRQNFAVLTDYAFMEAYKDDTLDMLYRSMEILSNYPEQVIVLKGTQIVCGLKGRTAGLQRRMIDQRQTRAFAEFCRSLSAARQGNLSIQRQLAECASAARHQMERGLIDAANFNDGLQEITNQFNVGELRILRTGAPFTNDIRQKFTQQLLVTAADLFKSHPRVFHVPNQTELRNTLIFRIALCMHILAGHWISVGGADKVKPAKIRNDLIDVSFAAYATYFDGILSNDKKAKVIYSDAAWMLKNVFVASRTGLTP